MMDEDEKVLNMEAEAKEKAELKAIAEAKSEKDEVAKKKKEEEERYETMCYNVCIFCTIKSLTLLFSTPITIISADTLCNFCSLLSLFQRSAPFLPLANPGGLQGIALYKYK